MQSGNASQVSNKLYHHGRITILVKKKLEEKGIMWGVFLKEFQATGAEDSASISTGKKRKAGTLSPAKRQGKCSPVQVEKRVIENNPPVAKKRKTIPSMRRKNVAQGTN